MCRPALNRQELWQLYRGREVTGVRELGRRGGFSSTWGLAKRPNNSRPTMLVARTCFMRIESQGRSVFRFNFHMAGWKTGEREVRRVTVCGEICRSMQKANTRMLFNTTETRSQWKDITVSKSSYSRSVSLHMWEISVKSQSKCVFERVHVCTQMKMNAQVCLRDEAR